MTKKQREKRKKYMRDYMRTRYAARSDVRQRQIDAVLSRYYSRDWKTIQENNQTLKVEVLTHYGRGGKLKCCASPCEVSDPDMLSLDHIKDDGAAHRKVLGAGTRLYRWAKSHGFPEGILQTLCYNHQMKKEITRRHTEISTRVVY